MASKVGGTFLKIYQTKTFKFAEEIELENFYQLIRYLIDRLLIFDSTACNIEFEIPLASLCLFLLLIKIC